MIHISPRVLPLGSGIRGFHVSVFPFRNSFFSQPNYKSQLTDSNIQSIITPTNPKVIINNLEVIKSQVCMEKKINQ